MIKGIESAAQGMMSIMTQNDIIANNLANINTAGFKQSTAVFKNAYEASLNHIETSNGYSKYGQKLGSLSVGSMVDATVLDFNQGGIKPTGNDLDLAITGQGLFTLESPDGNELYTRNGSFLKSQDGFITDINGNKLMAENGPIKIPPGKTTDIKKFKINENGFVSYDNKIVDKLKISDFEDRNTLEKLGTSLFKQTENSTIIPAKDFGITQGALESSNANTVDCMIKSIHGERIYESLSKVIQNSDRTLQKTISDVGRIKR